ncbi:MAG: hypothetical protein QM784_05115 [Polyangiaceae bacterium]
MARPRLDMAACTGPMAVFVCVVLHLIVLVVPGHAQARPDSDPPRVVALSRQSTPDVLEKNFFDALRSHLKELEIKLDLSVAPQTNDPLAIADDLTHTERDSRPLFYTWLVQYPPRVIVYLFEPDGPHLGARESTLGSSTAATSEELALILRSAILARRSGGRADLDEVTLTPATSTAPSAPPGTSERRSTPPNVAPIHGAALSRNPCGSKPSPPPLNFGATLGFAYEMPFSDDVFRGGLHTRLWLGSDAARIGLGYLATPSATLHTKSANLSLERRPADIFVSHTVTTDTVRLAGELRFVVDPLRRHTLAADSPLTPTPARTRWFYAVGAFASGEVSLTHGLAWTVWAGADITMNARSFDVTRGDASRETVAALLTVRPVVGSGLILFAR